MTQWAWTMLGIAPTDDVRAIRAAYAVELKSFDVDEEQARYARLREARDVAMHLARSTQPPLHSNSHEGIEDSPSIEQAPPPTDAPMQEGNADAPVDHAADAHYSSLLALLNASEDGDLPDAATSEAMLQHFRAILADPRMEQLSFRDAAERQFLHAFSSTAPRCDPLLHEAIEAFGWRQGRGQLRQPEIVDSLVRYSAGVANRRRLYESVTHFREELQKPDHPHNRAWREINKTADLPFASDTVTAQQVHNLLVILNDYFHPLLVGLDQERLHYWEKEFQKRLRLRNNIVVGSACLSVFAMMTLVALTPKESPAPQRHVVTAVDPSFAGLNRVEADVAPALSWAMPGTNVERLKSENPSLYGALQTRWEKARDAQVEPSDFSQATLDWLHSLFSGNLERASRADIAAYRSIELKRLSLLDKADDGSCVRYLSGEIPAPRLDLEDADRLARLEAKLLLITPYKARPPAPDTKTYTVPGDVIHRIQTQTGFTSEQISAGLMSKGPGRTQCRVRIALVQAALDTPGKEGLQLLRAM